MNEPERAVLIQCVGQRMVGVLAQAEGTCSMAVLIVVGGPQYRAGSHRQFTLLARALARNGIASLRFDYRGMGDSEGEKRTFESVGADLRAAVDCLLSQVPQAGGVVIWGLCDAASAALIYAQSDERVLGLVLANPWVRTESGEARALLKHYYRQRLTDPHLWRQLVLGRFDWRRAFGGVMGSARAAIGKARASNVVSTPATRDAFENADQSLPDRMAKGLEGYLGPVLLILSGNDLTAQEFRDVVARSVQWRDLLKRPWVSTYEITQANHTFSSREWRAEVEQRTIEWMSSVARVAVEQDHA